jgi:Co/Zn/Cd efflux system component
VWLASLPHNPQLALFAKARVLAEVCVGAVLLAVLAAAVRAPEAPTLTQLMAVLASAVACITSVVATCMLLSVRRPHRADLRGARDIPAPPGSMAVYSVRLSAMTTLTAIMLSFVSYATPWPWLPLVVAVPLTVRALLALLRIAREWDDPGVRAQVVTSVASG